MCREVYVLFLIFFLVDLTSSKCPELRKSHPTNCTMFYNCINLPGGQYVWAPSKCSEGLVFESYLRMCVLPSETWNCDSLSQPTVIRKKHEAELMKSYLDYNSNPSNFSETVYSSDPLDSTSTEDIIQETRPFLSNEDLVLNLANANENREVIEKKTGNSINDELNENENFSRFGNKTLFISSVTWFDRVIDNLLIHQSIKVLFDEKFLVNFSSKSEIKTSHSIKHFGNKGDALFNHFVTNYIIRNNIENSSEVLNKESETMKDFTKYDKLEATIPKIEIQSTSISDQSINSPEYSDSIIAVENNFGKRQYLTFEKYEFLKDQINPKTIKFIPCSTGIRFPNNTDCTKYYICEANTATLREFSCPSFTAFNVKTRMCDTRTYSSCKKMINENFKSTSGLNEIMSENARPLKKSVCESVGKFADPTSLSHYYICYSNNGNISEIESVKMMCPNNLIFCSEKKVCATKQFCAR